jgi:hypothetical protein
MMVIFPLKENQLDSAVVKIYIILYIYVITGIEV